jgi:hypothetical protein
MVLTFASLREIFSGFGYGSAALRSSVQNNPSLERPRDWLLYSTQGNLSI